MKDLRELKHIRRETPNGGQVYVLDTGAVINAEAEAMLQALHSRSIGGLRHHLDILEEKGADNFMKNFYVGYGHKSIGDCGSTTLFIEGVSMLAAKAIQDSRLYSGQEASTRYIDFSQQPFIDPMNNAVGKKILEDQRAFYLSLLDPIKEDLMKKYPQQEWEKDPIKYQKAINARAFDIARGFLPAGAATNLAWHSNLRQISDRLLFLRHHPLEEVRGIAETIEDAVIEAHPNSFLNKDGEKVRYPETEAYQDLIAENYFHHRYSAFNTNNINIGSSINQGITSAYKTSAYKSLFNKRPPKTDLPKFLSQLGQVYATFNLDFGSFRDIQRHRAIDQRMPLVTTEIGFNDWYMDNLPEQEQIRARNFLKGIKEQIDGLDISHEEKQYFVPMGSNTSNKISGDLPAMVYMVELRTTRFVHPTLRRVARKIGEYIRDEINVPIHFDEEPDMFDIRRGDHDISIR